MLYFHRGTSKGAHVSNLSSGGQGPSTATLLWQAVLQLLSTGEQKTHRQLPTVQEEGANPRSYSRYHSTTCTGMSL